MIIGMMRLSSLLLLHLLLGSTYQSDLSHHLLQLVDHGLELFSVGIPVYLSLDLSSPQEHGSRSLYSLRLDPQGLSMNPGILL